MDGRKIEKRSAWTLGVALGVWACSGQPDAAADRDAGSGGGGPDAGCEAARFATAASSVAFGPGQDVGRDRFPELVFGPPKGGGCCEGSVSDVVSLGNGGTVTLEFEASRIVDGPGADFIVFENAFWVGGDSQQIFAELGTVAVSDDGSEFVDFPCTAVEPPYGACAGWHPVFAHATDNDIDPLDPAVAGGDAFDLADVGLASARFVRITDREDLIGTNGVFDLDAVGIVHAACP